MVDGKRHLYCRHCFCPIVEYTGPDGGPSIGDADYADYFNTLDGEAFGVGVMFPKCPKCKRDALQISSLIF